MEDERSAEIEAIEAIFGDDFTAREDEVGRGKKGGRYSVFEVRVTPEDGYERGSYVSVVCTIRLGPRYPQKEAAKISVRDDAVGAGSLSRSRVQELQRLASQKAGQLVGRVHVYEVVCEVRDKLMEWNVASMTLHEEMLHRQATKSAEKMQIEANRHAEAAREGELRRREAHRLAEEKERERELEQRAARERNARKQQALKSADGHVAWEHSIGSNHDEDLADDLKFVLEDFNSHGLAEVQQEDASVLLEGANRRRQGRKQKKLSAQLGKRASRGTNQASLAQLSPHEIAGLERSYLPAEAADLRGAASIGLNPLSSSLSPTRSAFETSSESDSETDSSAASFGVDSEYGSTTTSGVSLGGPLTASSPTEMMMPVTSRTSRSTRSGAGRSRRLTSMKSTDSLVTRSRFRSDFRVLRKLGEGGFGAVVKARNNLDGRDYAIKRIKLHSEDLEDRSVVREVLTLSRLMHPNIVRYYQAWLELPDEEDGVDVFSGGEDSAADLTAASATADGTEAGSSDCQAVAHMYIQMEYCRSTLREFIDYADDSNRDLWTIFRQIVEALAYIHSKGVVHRDLKPTNIFFSRGGDIKVGDFGLAKSISANDGSREQDGTPTLQAIGGSEQHLSALELTGAVGTAHYRAPEVEKEGNAAYSNKVDIYSLGVIAWELWHGPCGTQMERIEEITKLRQTGAPDAKFEKLNGPQARLIRALMQSNPRLRPSAIELLDGDLLPRRLEDEYTAALLRQLSVPGSRLRGQALEALFSAEPASGTAEDGSDQPWGMKALDLGMSGSAANHARGGRARRADISQGQLRERVVDCARTVFRAHGALPTTCPPLVPETGLAVQATRLLADVGSSAGRSGQHLASSRFLTAGGNRVVLVEDARVSFAHSVVGEKQARKRYEVGMVWQIDDASGDGASAHSIPSNRKRQAQTVTGARGPSPVLQGSEVEQPPKSALFADFDIVLPGASSPTAGAEVIKAAAEVAAAMPLSERTYLRVGHSAIGSAVLWQCWGPEASQRHHSGLEDSMLQAAEVLMSWLPYTGWKVVEKALRDEFKMGDPAIKRMRQFQGLKGPPAAVLSQLVQMLHDTSPGERVALTDLVTYVETVGRRKEHGVWASLHMSGEPPTEAPALPQLGVELASAVNSLARVLTALEAMNVGTDEVVVLDPFFIHPGQAGRGASGAAARRRRPPHPELLYFNGLVFELFLRHSQDGRGAGVVTECIGWGGSWSGLVRSCARLQSQTLGVRGGRAAPNPYAVGVTLNLEKVLQLATRSANQDGELASSCDVFVCTTRSGFAALQEKLWLATELRSHGVRADYLYAAKASAHEQHEAAVDRGAKWTATVRRGRADSSALIRMKSLTNNRLEQDVAVLELGKFCTNLRRDGCK